MEVEVLQAINYLLLTSLLVMEDKVQTTVAVLLEAVEVEKILNTVVVVEGEEE